MDRAGREITSITRLEANVRSHHPNLLDIQHVGKTNDCLFYIMEPADDLSGAPASLDPNYQPASLKSRLRAGFLSVDECLQFTQGLLAGLVCLHDAGMVHRDVKPANCLFVGGELKLADFGLLTEADHQVSRLGTLKYMPPDGRMDTRADIYAAGLVIYEMITGLPPENAPRLGERAGHVADQPILRALNKLVLTAIHANPQQRFPDARSMLAALRIPEPTSSPHTKPWKKPRLAIITLVLIAIICLMVWWFWPHYVPINFISNRYEATIYLDGVLQKDPEGAPYKTPCTIPKIHARVQHVVLKDPAFGDLDLGWIDFTKYREINANWDSP